MAIEVIEVLLPGGLAGPQGEQGPEGSRGPKGDTGAQGPAGPPEGLGFILTPEMFGAVGDGVTDDTAAFLAFQSYAIANYPNLAVVLNGTGGKTYMVGNPWWPSNIRRLVFNGNGCKLQNNATDTKDMSLLRMSGGCDIAGMGQFYIACPRYLISTTAIGATTITCLTPAEAGNLVVGQYIMVASFDIQWGGQPPNYRQWEYVKVTAVDAITGIVTIDRRLKYVHQSNFPYKVYSNADGRAHIENIEARYLWGIEHTYNDIEFIKNVIPTSAVTDQPYMTGRSITFNRCIAPGFNESVLGYGVLNECTEWESGEIDKLIDHLEYNGCVLKQQAEATSVKYLKYSGCKLTSGYNFVPETLEMINCDVHGAFGSPVAIKNSINFPRRWVFEGGTHERLPAGIGGVTTQVVDVTINGTTVTWAGGVLTISPISTENNFVANAFVGQLIYVCSVDGSTNMWPTGVVGRVTGISSTVADQAIIAINFNAILAGTERLAMFWEPQMVEVKGVMVGGAFLNQSFFFQRNRYLQDNFIVTPNLTMTELRVFGRPTKVVIDVLRPYTGPTGGNMLLAIRNQWPATVIGDRLEKIVDLRTTGRREANLEDHTGWTGLAGESVGAALVGGSFDSRCVSSLRVTSGPTTGTTDQQPLVSFFVEFENPYTFRQQVR